MYQFGGAGVCFLWSVSGQREDRPRQDQEDQEDVCLSARWMPSLLLAATATGLLLPATRYYTTTLEGLYSLL